MKNYAKVGNRQGKPAYRTPAGFRYRKYLKISQAAIVRFAKIKKK